MTLASKSFPRNLGFGGEKPDWDLDGSVLWFAIEILGVPEYQGQGCGPSRPMTCSDRGLAVSFWSIPTFSLVKDDVTTQTEGPQQHNG